MSHGIPDIGTLEGHLVEKGQTPKPKILVVDDEPDNLDLLYRTFRRDFQVLRASSGKDALTVLTTEGEVAVIISDQRMPEMKGTEFLSRTVPQFPNTVRIILTGFTDVEDLVEAINSGQVYKYITKPWDPVELKDVVQHAARTYELLQQRTNELSRAKIQASLLKSLVEIPHQTSTVDECISGLAAAFGRAFSMAQCTIHQVTEHRISGVVGQYVAPDHTPLDIATAPLAQEAIATQAIKLFNHQATSSAEQVADYDGTGIGTDLAIPLITDGTPFFLLSMQWGHNFCLGQDDVSILKLLSTQLALILANL